VEVRAYKIRTLSSPPAFLGSQVRKVVPTSSLKIPFPVSLLFYFGKALNRFSAA